MLETLKFNNEVIEGILKYANTYPGEYIQIDINGTVLGKYTTQDEYYSHWFNQKPRPARIWERILQLFRSQNRT